MLTWFARLLGFSTHGPTEKAGAAPAPQSYRWVEIPWSAATREQKDAEMQRLTDLYRKTGMCPDCHQGELYSGPEGGCAVNVYCGNCDSWFNAMHGGFDVILQDRIHLEWKPATLMVKVPA